jgi:integrase
VAGRADPTGGLSDAAPSPADRDLRVAKFRDADGITRKVGRTGKTQAEAGNRLREHFRDRAHQDRSGGLSGDTRFRVLAEQWHASIEHQVTQGTRSPNTAQLYRLTLDTHVLPALGELRLREITVPRLDVAVQAIQASKGTASAKLARTVISGTLGVAVRHGAIPVNPTRDIARIVGRPKKAPRALTGPERRDWIAQLQKDKDARRKDLPDFCAWMLATGVRIGEALAVTWEEIDLDERTVAIDHTLIRVKGVGLLRKSTKSEAGERTLRLPDYVLGMLRRRKLAVGGRGPLFPDSAGGWRDPSNTSRDLRQARGSEAFAWVTSHVFRKTAATQLDEAGLSARQIADQLGHSKVSMTQNYYLGRRAVGSEAADALNRAHERDDEDPKRGVSGA